MASTSPLQGKIRRVCDTLIELSMKDENFAVQMLDALDACCDELLERQAFGKKGHLDPRGDQTKSFGQGGTCWTMRNTAWEDGEDYYA